MTTIVNRNLIVVITVHSFLVSCLIRTSTIIVFTLKQECAMTTVVVHFDMTDNAYNTIAMLLVRN